MLLASVGLEEKQGLGEYLCPQISLFYEVLCQCIQHLDL